MHNEIENNRPCFKNLFLLSVGASLIYLSRESPFELQNSIVFIIFINIGTISIELRTNNAQNLCKLCMGKPKDIFYLYKKYTFFNSVLHIFQGMCEVQVYMKLLGEKFFTKIDITLFFIYILIRDGYRKFGDYVKNENRTRGPRVHIVVYTGRCGAYK